MAASVDSRSGTPSLVRNAATLFGGQAIGLILPLATIPYIARVLRPEGWAPVIVAQALGNWLILMLEYGFDLSGTRAVARARHDPESLPEVVRGVQGAKLLLVPLATLILALAFLATPSLRAHPELILPTLAFAVLRGLNPFWFFQGMERVRGAVAVEAATKTVAALGVFAVVRQPADGWRVIALQAATAAVSFGILTRWMATETTLLSPRIGAGLSTLRRSWVVFGVRAAAGLSAQANTFVLSVLASPVAVAAFGGTERIVRAAINLLQPLTWALFPRVSFLSAADPANARRLIMQCLVGVGLFGGAIGLTAFVGAPLLVRLLLGAGYEAAVPAMRVFSALAPLAAVNTVFGLYWAVPFGHERAFLKTIIAAAAVNLALAFALVPKWGATGMCAATVGAELFVSLVLISLYMRRWHLPVPHQSAVMRS
jgi:PST family polysaccharide transporter